MTTDRNPLRRAVPYNPDSHPFSWHEQAAKRNAEMTRDDVEWIVNPKGDGMYLRSREDRNSGWREWKPSAEEIEATNAVVARAMAAGITGEQWSDMVRRGVITREVEKVMRENRTAAIAAE